MAHLRCVKIGQSGYDVYIGRPRVGADWGFGNPFQIGVDGTRSAVIAHFRMWLTTGETFGNGNATEARREWILANLWRLRGNVKLGCFCGPNLACHGDILIELAEREAE